MENISLEGSILKIYFISDQFFKNILRNVFFKGEVFRESNIEIVFFEVAILIEMLEKILWEISKLVGWVLLFTTLNY